MSKMCGNNLTNTTAMKQWTYLGVFENAAIPDGKFIMDLVSFAKEPKTNKLYAMIKHSGTLIKHNNGNKT